MSDSCCSVVISDSARSAVVVGPEVAVISVVMSTVVVSVGVKVLHVAHYE